MIFIAQDTELDIKSGLSIIYFYAPWLLFHSKILKDLNEIESTYKNVKFYGIDINQFKSLVTRFNITSLPSILVAKDEGKIIKNIIGIQAASSIRNSIHDIYKSYTESL
jgi:thioredoxin 1